MFAQGWIRPHVVVLGVGLKVPPIFGPGLIAAVLVKLVLSKLLLFLGGLNGFGISFALPHQENKALLPRVGVITMAQ